MATPPATIYHHTSQADVYTEPAQFSHRQKIRQLRLMAWLTVRVIWFSSSIIRHTWDVHGSWIADMYIVKHETLAIRVLPSKHGAFNQCRFDVGPASTTLAQHQNNTGWSPRVCWVIRYWSNIPRQGCSQHAGQNSSPFLITNNNITSTCSMERWFHSSPFLITDCDEEWRGGDLSCETCSDFLKPQTPSKLLNNEDLPMFGLKLNKDNFHQFGV